MNRFFSTQEMAWALLAGVTIGLLIAALVKYLFYGG